MFKSPSAASLWWFVSFRSATMENNVTLNFSREVMCEYRLDYVVSLSLIDIIPFLVGQPVITKLLWIASTSKKTLDILNCNLALFHNLQYLMSIVHFIVLFVMPNAQFRVLRFLLVYAQIGGPMSLAFICLERFVAVVHPMSYPLLKKYRCREVGAVMVWLFSVPTALVSILTAPGPTSIRDQAIKAFPFSVLVIMTVMVVRCSSSVAKTLKKSGPGSKELHPVKRRAFTTVCATSIIALFCYAPVTLMQELRLDEEYVCIFTSVCILLLSAASVVHPLFYLSAQRKLFACLK